MLGLIFSTVPSIVLAPTPILYKQSSNALVSSLVSKLPSKPTKSPVKSVTVFTVFL